MAAGKPAVRQLRRLFDPSTDMLCVAGFDGYLKAVNDALGRALGYPADEFLAKPLLEFVYPDDRDATGAELKRTQEIVTRQAEEILELSIPIMQVWDGVLVAPLIGTLESQRTQQLMEHLLQRVIDTNSPVALVDITGVPVIDTQTAQHLVETITAVRLLDAQVVLTGVRPAIAQTLVHLGIDLGDITTHASLSAGLGVALAALNLQVVSSGSGTGGVADGR